MKRVLLLFTISLILFSCVKKESNVKEKQKDDFLKTPEYTTSTNTYTTSTTDNSYDGKSYWFVYVEDMDNTVRRNDFIMQDHTWFSYKEAVQHFKNESKKDCFIISFIRVDKETYEHNQE